MAETENVMTKEQIHKAMLGFPLLMTCSILGKNLWHTGAALWQTGNMNNFITGLADTGFDLVVTTAYLGLGFFAGSVAGAVAGGVAVGGTVGGFLLASKLVKATLGGVAATGRFSSRLMRAIGGVSIGNETLIQGRLTLSHALHRMRSGGHEIFDKSLRTGVAASTFSMIIGAGTVPVVGLIDAMHRFQMPSTQNTSRHLVFPPPSTANPQTASARPLQVRIAGKSRHLRLALESF